jgi:N-acetylglutamate synthase-like GNAT family acetyltransferase
MFDGSIPQRFSFAMKINIRKAELKDCAEIGQLIAESARRLGKCHYSEKEIEAALRGAWGLDTQLIRDGTYYVALAGNTIVGCGGWSYRRTLFGSDSEATRDDTPLDPRFDAARVRAFFVAPSFARRGIGSILLDRCEQEASGAGFRSLTLGATYPGERFYAARGFIAGKPEVNDLGNGVTMAVIPMRKELDAES